MISPSSYGFASGDVDGWGPRYYYSYYTTLGGRDDFPIIAESLLYAFIFLLSVAANLSILLTIISKKSAHTVTNCFILNLACVDLVLVSSSPLIAVARSTPSWTLGSFACKIIPFSQVIGAAVLLWTLTGISVDRRYCLEAAPYKLGLSKRTVVSSIFIIWLICFFLTLPIALFFREQMVEFNHTSSITKNETFNICTLVFPTNNTVSYAFLFTMVTVFIFCVIPMAILVYNYVLIYKKLREIQNRLELKLGRQESNQPTSIKENIQSMIENIKSFTKSESLDPKHSVISRTPSTSLLRLEKHKRSIKILYTNVAAMLIMWTPVAIVMCLIYTDGHYENNGKFYLSNQHFIWSVVCCLLNTLVNPIIYGFLTENFRYNFPMNVLIENCINSKENSTSTDASPSPVSKPNSVNSEQKVTIRE